jgi:transposase-like protein
VQSPKTNCPRCSSKQAFARLKRPHGSIQEVYIRCTMCRWERLIEYTSPELESLRSRYRKAKTIANAEQVRLGAMSLAKHRMLMRLMHQMVNLESEVNRQAEEGQGG